MKMKIVAVVAVLLGAAAGFASDPPTGPCFPIELRAYAECRWLPTDGFISCGETEWTNGAGVQLSCCDFGDGICLGEYGTCATCGMRM